MSKELLRTEFKHRIREAVTVKDWTQLEHWARQWILMDPKHGDGFKWLARASVALNKVKRAAYAYGRLLDFEPQNEEARKFFESNPSTLLDPKVRAPHEQRPSGNSDDKRSSLLSPGERSELGKAELSLARTYENFHLYAEAAQRFQKSFDWQPSEEAALGCARCLHCNSQGLEAVRFLRKEIFHFHDWIEGRMLLARIHFDIGQNAEAQREWQMVLQVDPENREALNWLRGLYATHAGP